MADDSLDLLIKIQSDTTQLKQAVDGVEDLKGKVQQSAGAHREATTEATKHGGAHRELHRAMERVTEASPVLGVALRAIFSPLGALITVAIIAMELFKKAMEDARGKAAELHETSGALWQSHYDGAKAASDSASAYAKTLREVSEAVDSIGSKYSHDKAVLDELIDRQKVMLDQMEKMELAGAGGDKDREAAIRERFVGLHRSADMAGSQAQFDLKTREQFEREQTLPSLRSAADRAQAMLQNVQRDKPSEVTEAELFLARNGGREKGRGVLEGKLADAKSPSVLALGEYAFSHPTLTPDQIKSGILDEAQKNLARFESALRTIDAFESVLKEVQENAASAANKFKSAQHQAQSGSEELVSQRDALSVRGGTVFRQDKFGEAADALGGAERAARKFSSGQKLNADEDMLMRSVGSMVAGQNVSSGTAAQMLRVAQNSQKVQEQFLEKLLATMTRMSESGLKKFETQLTQINRRLQSLEAGAVSVQ